MVDLKEFEVPTAGLPVVNEPRTKAYFMPTLKRRADSGSAIAPFVLSHRVFSSFVNANASGLSNRQPS